MHAQLIPLVNNMNNIPPPGGDNGVRKVMSRLEERKLAENWVHEVICFRVPGLRMVFCGMEG